MELTSPAFGDNQAMPDTYTTKGGGISPPLTITGVPAATQSLALILHDPDAPRGDFLHWTVWNIPPATAQWPEHTVPEGSLEGVTDYGKPGYGPPAPPTGTHRYVFDLYALDTELPLKPGTSRDELETALKGHTLAQTQLIGLASA